MNIKITLPDGSVRTYPSGITIQKIASEIGERLEKASVAGKVGEKIVDLNTPLNEDCSIKIITRDSKEGLEVIRHSTAHLLAMAVKEMYPETQVTIGPVTEDGFYYDFDRPTQFTIEDLPKIEKKMAEIASRALNVTRTEHSKADVIKIFKSMKEDFKVEIIESIPESTFSSYQQGDFVDLCRGPHVPNTSRLGKFKLLSVAGAYWRGDEKNKMLQRIYGTAFANQKELDEHIHNLEEAKKRDHRKLGPEMGLFTFMPIAPAMPFFLPKGARLLNLMMQYMRDEMRVRGYSEVVCPQVLSNELWKTSGHLDNYSENMYLLKTEDGVGVGLKPMNCPAHATLFGVTKHSYRELPIRYAEFTRLHRFERAGVTHGLMRTRTFSQDDAHIFCTEDQILSETLDVIKHTQSLYRTFGFTDIVVKLATRPDKFLGDIETWNRAEKTLEQALNQANQPFEFNHKDGAFYGPKIEFHIKDSIKRMWQCGTIQLDYNFPERFQLDYVDSDGKNKRPVMIHRAVLGSFERFLAILLEHHAGHIPLWINPLQAMIINVTPDQEAYAKNLNERLLAEDIRVEVDTRNEKLGYKIREAQLQRIPLMLVIGQKEMDTQTISVRKRTGETVNSLSLDGFMSFFKEEIKGVS